MIPPIAPGLREASTVAADTRRDFGAAEGRIVGELGIWVGSSVGVDEGTAVGMDEGAHVSNRLSSIASAFEPQQPP